MYVPIGNFLLLNDDKTQSKMFTTMEFNRVVEALDILKDAEMSTSLIESHRMDNYLKILQRNEIFYPNR